MTTNPTTAPPAWLNLDAIHPPEERAKLPALVGAAKGVLEAVVAFNREHLDQMHAYYERNNDGPDDLRQVDELTGMDLVDQYLMLAGHIIESTVVGQGTAMASYAKELATWHAELIEGVRALYSGEEWAVPGFAEVQG